MKLNRALSVLLVLLILPAFMNADLGPKPDKTPIVLGMFFSAFALTLIIELLVATAFLYTRKLNRSILLAVLVANVITMPLTWFVFPAFFGITLGTLVSEAFAILFEAGLMFFMNKKAISMKQALLLSVLMNAASFFIGGEIFRAMLG